MAFPRRWVGMLLALLVGAGLGRAADSKKEQHAYEVAVAAFHGGLWNLAETDLAQFVQTYPESTNVPAAWLFTAQAIVNQGRFAEAEATLAAHKPAAGALSDAYTYWLGEAQFQSGDRKAAAVTLASLPKTSAYALQAAVEAAAALAELNEWPALIAFLDGQKDVFDAAARTDPDNELVLRGRLLLAQAHFAKGEFDAAGNLLGAFQAGKLPPDLEWKRVYLLCQVKLSAGDPAGALPLAADSLNIARVQAAGDGGTNLAASVALHAQVLERLGRPAEAAAAFQENLSTNAPPERQQEAVLKIAALSVAQGQFTNAEANLNNFVTQFTNSPALDVALLALGELYLRDYADRPAEAGLLTNAQTRFDQLLAAYPNSSFAGQAYLNRGWCGWLTGNYAASRPDFRNAADKLPPSEDLAVARFKLGDALFIQRDFAGALAQYQAVLEHFGDFPQVAESLGDRARYQCLRAQLELGDLAGAAASMAPVAAGYPASELTQSSTLLLGEGYTDLRQPTNALALFGKFQAAVPQSPLRPQVDLAIARAYEEEQDWPAAIRQYEHWLTAYPTNGLLAQALYSQAWANYQAGNETNALRLFTNFVARFPLNDLAPTAQMWVGDHYYRLGDWFNAELNYKFIFQNTNWQTSALYYQAEMMAGRAAVSRTGYAEAIRDYFQSLENDPNCPLDLRVQATFAHGSTLMKMDSPDTNNPTANFQQAVSKFSEICASFPTNEWGARAWGYIGKCYLQQPTRYDDATNAFAQALNLSTNLAVRNEAQIGLGIVLEKKAALLPAGPDQKALLNQALVNYWAVLNENDRDQDPFWTEKAGLKAAGLAAALEYWPQTILIYSNLVVMLPELKDSLNRKIALASQHVNAGGK